MRAVVPVCLLLSGGALAGGVWAERRAISADLGRPRDLHGTGYVGSEGDLEIGE
ncbi:MAG TPA: hypothetical protein VKZ18_26370 [Polyangia bacterium]|nr:hypothetical protein [Polyangia bacterium]